MKTCLIYACISIVIFFVIGIGCNKKKVEISEDKEEIFSVMDSTSQIKDMPVLKFEKTKYDFGTIKKDSPLTVCFNMQNTGDAPLVIYKVDVSCGCLTADYPKQPMKVNEKGVITVTADTKGFTGAFNKTLFVRSNAIEDIILLRIFGQIK